VKYDTPGRARIGEAAKESRDVLTSVVVGLEEV
jgi:hypothetical protein